MPGSFEIARSFVAVSLLTACRLDASAKTGCVTTADCVAPHVCVRSTCVAPDANTALTTAMCGALPPSEILSVVPGRAGPQWQAARVDLPATSNCAYMDETEVTVAEYGAWADASGGFTDWDSRCVPWKTTVSDPERSPSDACVMAIPADEDDHFAPDKPIRCVDWCDAEAFCRDERGGHLCYRTAGGGSVQPENEPDEWPSACSNADTTVWPWGNGPDATLCNIGQPATGCTSVGFSCGVAPVRSFTGCVNENGIFDLIGNVQEWLGICAAIDPSSPDGTCALRGGGYDDSLAGSGCGLDETLPKATRLPDVGFRCCYDLTAAQREMAGQP
jgi:sulfatase modifying factor 1